MTSPLPSPNRSTADAVVVGDGLVALCSALALADAGLRVLLAGHAPPGGGAASPAAAGMLAPSVESTREVGRAAHHFGLRARDGYAAYVAALEARSGVHVPMVTEGVLQVALDDAQAAPLAATASGDSRWLPPPELARLEPALAHAAGALLHPRDGAVDNRLLLEALRRAAAAHPRIRQRDARVARLAWAGGEPTAHTTGGDQLAAALAVVATGAWLGTLAGLPRALPVEPVRGQLLALDAAPLRHVAYGPGGYLVPRGGRTVVGSTMERVGFDCATTAEGIAGVRRTGERICPALCGAPELERWAGLRPVTPDGLPILGRDPRQPSLLWAVGHSRNGVLLAPLTGQCVAALAVGTAPPADLAPFDPERFERGAAA